ncbi:hypothetical protein [Micromonospora sp. NPDC126480]|uniref:hypothetical protein n=1 Tax=Micromonospora sp. NPDC126480 TaxID=3155312 RepID=UPI00332699DB
MSTGRSLLADRLQWNRMVHPPAVLRVTALASYTIDPLVPYLGLGLHRLGLPPALTVGPFNQIVQQCLDDTAETARSAPDVLVVSPRFEESGPVPAPDSTGREPTGEEHLLAVAEAAVAAAGRWHAALVFVLPALPDEAPDGVGDQLSSGGLVASATATRERLRRMLENRPNVLIADAEAVVRAIGARNAHHESLFRHARIPYTEEVFAALAAQITRLVRLRYSPATRAVVLDSGVGAEEVDPTRFAPLVGELRRHGIRIAWHGNRPDGLGDPDAEAPPAADPVVEPDAEPGRLDALIAAWDLTSEEVTLVTGSDAPPSTPVGVTTVPLPPDPADWSAAVRSAGVFDRWPCPPRGAPAEPAAQASSSIRSRTSLADYVASLDVSIDWRTAGADDVPQIAEMLLRTKDFTLGLEHSEEALAAALADGKLDVRLARVRDRFGDYGVGAAVGVRQAPPGPVAELLLVSCPALGKGVEEDALRELLSLVPAAATGPVTVPYRDTGRNGIAIEFLRNAADRDRLRVTQLQGASR